MGDDDGQKGPYQIDTVPWEKACTKKYAKAKAICMVVQVFRSLCKFLQPLYFPNENGSYRKMNARFSSWVF